MKTFLLLSEGDEKINEVDRNLNSKFFVYTIYIYITLSALPHGYNSCSHNYFDIL